MKPTCKLAAILFLGLLVSCASTQRYYSKTSLNHVAIGQTKADVMAMYPSDRAEGGAPGMQIIQAKMSADGRLREVGEVLLSDGVSRAAAYRFVFEDGTLVQWGPY